MSAIVSENEERRGQSQKMVDDLQQERKEVWALFCQIAEQKPFEHGDKLAPVLGQFAEILVDYVSFGHFCLFERALSGNERRAYILEVVKQVYSSYVQTTDAVLAFNDNFDSVKDIDFNALEQNLSHLGEDLAKRMDLEDQVCAALLKRQETSH